MSYRILHLIRHGQMNPDPTHPLAEENGWPLTQVGREQAVLTGQRLRSLPIRHCYHSTYPRARETAQLMAQYIPTAATVPTPALCECIPYVPEWFRQWYASTVAGQANMQQNTIPTDMIVWWDLWSGAPALDDVAQGQTQIARITDRFFHPAGDTTQHDVLVSHANLIGALLCHSLGLPPEQWLTLIADLYNCSISEVLIEPSGHIRLLSFNDAGHLPFTLRTDNDRPMYFT